MVNELHELHCHLHGELYDLHCHLHGEFLFCECLRIFSCLQLNAYKTITEQLTHKRTVGDKAVIKTNTKYLISQAKNFEVKVKKIMFSIF